MTFELNADGGVEVLPRLKVLECHPYKRRIFHKLQQVMFPAAKFGVYISNGEHAKPQVEESSLRQRAVRSHVASGIFVRRQRRVIDGTSKGGRQQRAKPKSPRL